MNTEANLWKSKTLWGWLNAFEVICVCFLLWMIITSAQAHNHHQVEWEPNKYTMVCHTPPCTLNEALKRKAENLMPKAVDGVRGLNFKAPRFWGDRIGLETNDAIELYEAGDGIAGASPKCKKGDKSRAGMVIGNGFAEYSDSDYVLYYFLAHEVFHLIQFSYPFWDEGQCDKHIPGWILEGTADAVGLEAMRKSYPAVAPTNRNDREARKFAGLRRYDIPLSHRRECVKQKGVECGKDGELWSGDNTYYYTSSFWRHLANTYYKGNHNYLDRYMSRAESGGDWVNWLRQNLEKDTNGHLGMAFSGFLADYAGWGDRSFPGQFFGRKKWLKEVHGGCETVYLDKNQAVDYIDVPIRPLSGECIEVVVSALGESGIKEDESAAVQVAAIVMEGNPCNLAGGLSGPTRCGLHGLHLSLAISNDKKRFHCANEVKRRGKVGVGRCMFTPDDGKIRIAGGEEYARVWNVKAQQPAKGKGNLVNLYTVSYTPVDVSSKDTKFGGIPPTTFRLYFVLDVAKLKLQDSQAASIGGKKEPAVAHFAEGGDPQTTLPKQDERGLPANSYSLPESLRPSMPVAPLGSIGAATGKLGQIIVSQGQTAGVVLVPGKLDAGAGGKLEPRPLSVGETGEFPVGLISGNLNGEPLVALGPGSMRVDEFTDLVFRASYSGTMCRLSEFKPKTECPTPVSVSGQVVKAFVGSRLPGQHMKIERTPGTEMYRKANEAGMAAWSTATSGPAAPGGDSPTSGTQTGEGGAIEDCACTCEEFETTNRAAEEMKQREAVGKKIGVGAVMGLMRCHSACQREYMICAMEQGDRERAARKERQKAQRSEAVKDCDCSCTALQNLEAKTVEILEHMQSGNQSAMQEMQKLGQCMSVCQDALLRCARSR